MTFSRRELLKFAVAATAVATPSFSRTARSQSYPARSIRVIVPVAAGGSVDVITRLIVQHLSERWASQLHVENLPSGAGNVAAGVAAKAPSDGYTALTVTTALVINPGLYANLPYDPVKDFAPITLVGASSHVLVVHPSLPATNVNELVSLVRGNPNKYSYASPGTGQSGQLAGEMFRLECGLNLVHVPFNGAVPAITSTIAGHTQIAFMSLAAAASAIRGGNLRALAVTSRRRSEVFPEIPTMAEAGIPNQEIRLLARHGVSGGDAEGNRPSLARRHRQYHRAARREATPGGDELRADWKQPGGIRCADRIRNPKMAEGH